MNLCETFKVSLVDRYINLFENMPIGCFVVDLGGDILDVNPKALEILGSPSEEETKKINILLYTPLIDAGVSDIVKRSLSSESKITRDILYTSKWGKTSTIKFTVVPLYDESGEVCFSLVMMEDVSSYEVIKIELNRTNKMLKSVIDSIPSLIWMKDENGRYLFTNRAFNEFNAFLNQDLVGKTDYDLWPKDQADKFTDEDTLVNTCDYPLDKIDTILHPTLGQKYYHTIKIGVCDENKSFVGTVGVSCDVSKQHEQDKILAEAIETLTSTLDGNTYVK